MNLNFKEELSLCLFLYTSCVKGCWCRQSGINTLAILASLPVVNWWQLYNIKTTLYTSKQPLKMAYERSESTRDDFGKFIYQDTYLETWKDLNKII